MLFFILYVLALFYLHLHQDFLFFPLIRHDISFADFSYFGFSVYPNKPWKRKWYLSFEGASYTTQTTKMGFFSPAPKNYFLAETAKKKMNQPAFLQNNLLHPWRGLLIIIIIIKRIYRQKHPIVLSKNYWSRNAI